MSAHEQAVAALASMFTDAGNTMLYEAGFDGSWDAALRVAPEALLHTAAADPVLGLGQLRDQWSVRGQLRPAIALTRGLLKRHLTANGETDPAAIMEFSMMGALALRGGKQHEAGQILAKAWAQIRSVVPRSDERVAVVAGHYGKFLVTTKQFAVAEQVIGLAYHARKEAAPEKCGLLAAQLAEIMLVLGKVEESLPLLRDAWHCSLDDYGTDDPRTVARARILANVLRKFKLYREAAPVLREVYNFVRKHGKSEEIAVAGYELGVALHHSYKKEEGYRLVEEAVRWSREAGTIVDPHDSLPSRLTTLATMLIDRNRVEEAEGLLLEALEAEKNLYGEDSSEVAGRYAMLGYYCERTGRLNEALGWLDVASSLFRSAEGDKSPKTLQVVETQVRLLTLQAKTAHQAKDFALYRELIKRANRLGRPVLGDRHPEMLEVSKLLS